MFNRCPRCGGEWVSPHSGTFDCYVDGCDVSYYPCESPRVELVFVHFGTFKVEWNIIDKRCSLYGPQGIAIAEDIGWLPFTVSKEDVAKYIVLV